MTDENIQEDENPLYEVCSDCGWEYDPTVEYYCPMCTQEIIDEKQVEEEAYWTVEEDEWDDEGESII